MRRIRLFSVFVLLALFLSVRPGVMLAQEPPLPRERATDGVQPLASFRWAGASRWENPWVGGQPHKLAVWTAPHCRLQEYRGPGGYADTCSSSHGCINLWSWWLLSPESKLGVPLSWWR
jgi:hypothetical protein